MWLQPVRAPAMTGPFEEENLRAIQQGFDEGWRAGGGSEPPPALDAPFAALEADELKRRWFAVRRPFVADPNPFPVLKLWRWWP